MNDVTDRRLNTVGFYLYSRRGKTTGIENKIGGCLGMGVKGVIDPKGE